MAGRGSQRRLHYSLEDSFYDWSELQPELLMLVLSKLSFVQIIRFKAVCSSWRSIAESYLSSVCYSPFPQTPWLLLPPSPPHHTDTGCFFSLEEKKMYLIKNMRNQLRNDAWCFGSSHGWMLLLDKEANPFLLNPFSQVRIQLPAMEFSLFQVNRNYFIKHLRKVFITKGILSSDPSHDNNYQVVLIFGHISKLAFCAKEDSYWTVLDGASEGYSDIICNNHLLYALTLDDSIEVWEFHTSKLPIKKRKLYPSMTTTMAEATNYFRALYSSQTYLVESSGNLLLVIRYLVDYLNEIDEHDNATEILMYWAMEPLVCPYQTLFFHVYKLDSNEKTWSEVDSLKNEVLFLGGNHSMSLSAQQFPELERNSIYFTDDNWNQMNDDYFHGGHDFGMFSMEDKTMKPFYDSDSNKIDPPPFWIVPNPW